MYRLAGGEHQEFIDMLTERERITSTSRYTREREVNKGVWRMPRLSEAKKDVTSCEKLRGGANNL